MAPKGANRFALLYEDDNPSSPGSDQASDTDRKPTQNTQVHKENLNPWHEVKSRTSPSKKTNTLVIRDENQPSARTRPNLNPFNHRPNATDTRKISSSSDGNGVDRPYNPNENWCGVCHTKFPSKSLLLSHVKQAPNHQNYCNLCKRVFKDRNGLKNHVDNALDHDVFCNLCLSAFKDKWGLRNHFENNYSVGHEFVCLTCLMAFRSRNEMETHLKSAPKHVSCNTCHRRFRNQDERDEHWRKTTSKMPDSMTFPLALSWLLSCGRLRGTK